MKRIAAYISGKSDRLLKFLQTDSVQSRSIVFVFSDELLSDELREELIEREIAYYELDYKTLGDTVQKKRKMLSDIMLDEFENEEIDYCISFGKHILVGELLVRYKDRIINFHPAILPMYRGTMAIDQAVEEGSVMLVGNTAHFIDEGIDTGKIIMQSVIPIKAFFDNDRNYDTILDLQIVMLKKILYLLETESISVVDDRVEISGADYSASYIFPNIA